MSTLSLPSAKQIKVFERTSTALKSLVAIWKAYVAWRVRSAAKIALYQLDDRTLKDIGLHRSEIDSAGQYSHARPDHELIKLRCQLR
jgi:uncharacterized protein YjiS (DUF1127 family)